MAVTSLAPEKPRPGDALRDAVLVVLTFVVAMGAAWGLKTYVQQRSARYTATGGDVTLAYPAGWVSAHGAEGVLLVVSDPQSGALYRPRFTVQTETVAQQTGLREVVGLRSLRQSTELREYRELSSHETTVSGQRAIAVTYGYVADPPAGAGLATLPIVVEATDVQMIQGAKLYVFTAASDAGDAAAYGPLFERILASIQVRITP